MPPETGRTERTGVVLADLVLVDDDVVEVEQRFDDLSLVTLERAFAGGSHGRGPVNSLGGLEPLVIESRDRGVVTGRAVEEGVDELGVDEGHVAGDDDGILPCGLA